MRLHDQIMNLPDNWPTSDDGQPQAWKYAYKIGHRDARHAAAELAIAVEQQRDELLAELKAMLFDLGDFDTDEERITEFCRLRRNARPVVANAEAKQ